MPNENFSNIINTKLPSRILGIFTFILLAAIGCTWWITRNHYDSHIETDKAFLRLDSSLNTATRFLIRDCIEDSIYVGNKSRQPGYEKILIRYKPKIDSTMFLARRMHDYIQSVKSKLNSPDLQNSDEEGYKKSKQVLKENLITEESATILFDSLYYYSIKLLSVLPYYQKCNFSLPIDTLEVYSKKSEVWFDKYFDKRTITETVSTLTNLDYKVWLSANQMTEAIRSQWSDDLFFENFNVSIPFVDQNSMYFLPGQTLEISAGLGEFTTTNKPLIFINGIKQEINSDGIAIYKMKISDGKGGSLPVTVSFKDPNTGEIRTMSKNITYTVLQQPKN